MAYNELIKDFSGIRNYMREFYVFGFKLRHEYGAKSIRSYDNERRRLESWFGEEIGFQQTSSGKQVFLSVNSRTVARNPLYRAFRAKSFTDNDIVFHFVVLDLLHGGRALPLSGIVAGMDALGLSGAGNPFPDDSTVRKKLKEYTALGILETEKQGRSLKYRLSADRVHLPAWEDAAAFFSEAAPLGVIGSYLSDLTGTEAAATPFRFRHHYLLNALDSEILYSLALALRERRRAVIGMWSVTGRRVVMHDICPARFFISTWNGRQYVLGTLKTDQRPLFIRLDLIKSVTPGPEEADFDLLRESCDAYTGHLWGVSGTPQSRVDHLEMRLGIRQDEKHVLMRLLREKRGGSVRQEGPAVWVFSIDVYDAAEMLPWIRTFTGHILSLTCTNPHIVKCFRDDLKRTLALYSGGENDLP